MTVMPKTIIIIIITMRWREVPVRRSPVFKRSEDLLLQEKPTPAGVSRNSKFANLFHENLFRNKPDAALFILKGPTSSDAPYATEEQPGPEPSEIKQDHISNMPQPFFSSFVLVVQVPLSTSYTLVNSLFFQNAKKKKKKTPKNHLCC